jgi:hypothetical protein
MLCTSAQIATSLNLQGILEAIQLEELHLSHFGRLGEGDIAVLRVLSSLRVIKIQTDFWGEARAAMLQEVADGLRQDLPGVEVVLA